MKKSLLAMAAMTAFAGAAQAQSSVTVYGVYDGGYNNNSKDTTTAGVSSKTITSGMSGGEAASSRIGFKGVEDIGGGTKATFNLEFGFAAGTGTTGVTTATTGSIGQDTGVRAATVGLTNSKFGTINVGRQLTGIHGIVAGSVFGGNNMVGDATYSSFTGTNSTVNTRLHYNATRMSNSVAYITPTFSGFSARADWTSDQTTTANDSAAGSNVGNMGLAAKYVYGPVTLQAGYDKVQNGVVAARTDTSINAYSATYKKDALVVEAVYGNNKTNTTSTGIQASKVNSWKLGASYAVGKFNPFVKYGQGKTSMATSVADADVKGYQLGSTYSLSKRTNLYAAYGYQDSKVTASTTAANIGNGVKQKEISAGLVHTF